MGVREEKERLMDKTFSMMFLVLVIFGVPAVGAYFAGRWLDTFYDIRPMGSVIALAVAAAISWTIMIRLYIVLNRRFKELDEKEAQEERDAPEVAQSNSESSSL